MALLPSPTNDTTLTVERDDGLPHLVNGNGNPAGDEARWTHDRINGNTVTNAPRTSDSAIIFHFRKPTGRADAHRFIGHAPIVQEDAEDMARLCAGDDEAMTRLMGRHAGRLQGVIARMLRDWNEAADVVDEAFIRVYRHRHRFDLQARFTTWLYTIALNLARNRLRHRARQPEFVSLNELTEAELESQQAFAREPSPDAGLENSETMHGFETSLAALPPQLREPLELFACDELSQAEIAGLFHCSAKAIETRLYHARKRLRADFERFLRPRREWFSVCPFKPQHKIEITK